MNAPLSAAEKARIVEEARARVALYDISRAKDALFEGLRPVPHHARAALECLEADDDVGLEHHMERLAGALREAWPLWKALKSTASAQSIGRAP